MHGNVDEIMYFHHADEIMYFHHADENQLALPYIKDVWNKSSLVNFLNPSVVVLSLKSSFVSKCSLSKEKFDALRD